MIKNILQHNKTVTACCLLNLVLLSNLLFRSMAAYYRALASYNGHFLAGALNN